MSEQQRGRFIVFEGIDGAGKTTQISLLEQKLRSEGRRVMVTAEPTVSVTGGLLRDALGGISKRTAGEMAAMFVLDRIFHNVNPVTGIEKMLADAAGDAGVSLRQIEHRTQSPDHPILWNVPETDYLKFYLFQVV